MEGFNKKENAKESDNGSIIFNNENLMEALVGYDIKTGFNDLLKVYAIIKLLSNKSVKSDSMIKMLAEDLFEQLQVEVFTYDDIFTKKIRNQIINTQKPITSISFKLGDRIPFTIESGTKLEDLIKKFREESYIEDLNKEIQRKHETENELLNRKEIINGLLNQLESLNFTDIEMVLNWLKKYNRIAAYEDIGKIYNNQIINTFESNGFSSEMNDKMDFIIAEAYNDKESYSKVIVGCILANLGWIKEGQMEDLIKKWVNWTG